MFNYRANGAPWLGITLTLLVMLVWPVWGTGSAGTVIPTATSVTGTAWVNHGALDGWRLLREGDSLPEGATIRTAAKARVLVSLGPRGSIVIGPNSTLSLSTTPRAGEPERLRLTLGRVWVSIIKRFDPDSRFEVVTPTAVVSVRGTLFSVSADEDGESRVSVQSGLVSVTGDASEVSVAPGMQTRVQRGKGPEKPAEMDKTEHESWSEVREWSRVRLDSEKAAGKDEVPPGKAKPKPNGQTSQSAEDESDKDGDHGKSGTSGYNGKGQPH